MYQGFPGDAIVVKNLPANAGDIRDAGLIPGSGRSSGEGNGSPFQYSCLENPMDGGAWWARVHGVTKSQTQLTDFTFLSFYINTKHFYMISINTELSRKVMSM